VAVVALAMPVVVVAWAKPRHSELVERTQLPVAFETFLEMGLLLDAGGGVLSRLGCQLQT